MGAHRRWAATADPVAATAPARAALMRKYELQVDPELKLPPEERERRAAHARQAHMAELALERHRKRRKPAA